MRVITLFFFPCVVYVHQFWQKLSVFSPLSFLPLSAERAHQLSHQTIGPHILTKLDTRPLHFSKSHYNVIQVGQIYTHAGSKRSTSIILHDLNTKVVWYSDPHCTYIVDAYSNGLVIEQILSTSIAN